jgi:hypothetical protein
VHNRAPPSLLLATGLLGVSPSSAHTRELPTFPKSESVQIVFVWTGLDDADRRQHRQVSSNEGRQDDGRCEDAQLARSEEDIPRRPYAFIQR